MSKSLGNLEFVDRLRKHHDPRALRLALIANHYRREWEWTTDSMPRAHSRLENWSLATQGDGSAGIDQVRNALDDDLNVPDAIAVLDDAAKSGHSVALASRLLGVEI